MDALDRFVMDGFSEFYLATKRGRFALVPNADRTTIQADHQGVDSGADAQQRSFLLVVPKPLLDGLTKCDG